LSDYQTIRLDIAGDIATITLARPDRLNAAPPAMFDDIRAAIATLPGQARALILTGEGRAFCSGADIASDDGAQSVAGGERARNALTSAYNPTLLALARLPIPVVSAVNGLAAGIGCSLALVADFVIAARSAYFLQAFVNIGLVPDGGASWLLPRLIGKARATEMMMLGERLPAETAAEWGLIHKAVDDDALMVEARTLAARLAAGPTLALGLIRQQAVAALEQDYATAMAAEAEQQHKAGDSADALEGISAFMEKRKPVFKGR